MPTRSSDEKAELQEDKEDNPTNSGLNHVQDITDVKSNCNKAENAVM